MRLTKRPVLLDSIMKETIPMRGRMIHGISSTGELFEEPQDYDVHGRVSHSNVENTSQQLDTDCL